ncbi:uncharacterized protein LOC129753317 [Uranotaenia lowii]|uniref:uncharacterized protein LOC129753317 n=1 Tax=Uranotaenia lowii TaxID=190385 RepID=UPI00247AFE81|nr:uncharacterized protein LOC129753317 [Uranotaenia lowii]
MGRRLEKWSLILVPIVLHACSISVVDVVTSYGETPKSASIISVDGTSSEAMLPDVASLMFVTASSLLTGHWLRANLLRRRVDSDPMKFSLSVAIAIFLNVVFCDLQLRLVWIPVQYFLRFLRDRDVFVNMLNVGFFYLRFLKSTRNILEQIIKVSKSEQGFIWIRNSAAFCYLLGVAYYHKYVSYLVDKICSIRNGRR